MPARCGGAMNLISVVVGLTLVATSLQQNVREPASVQEQLALKLAIKKVPPTYPQQAKAVRLEGIVTLRVLVTAKGIVDQVEVVSGHPLLVQGAIDAVRQWKFKPYVEYGHATPFTTALQIPFTLDIPKEERQLREELKRLVLEGQTALKTGDKIGAEKSLRQAVALGEKLPDDYYLDFTASLEALGGVYLRERKYQEAQLQYQRQLEILRRHLEPDESEIGGALVNLALVSDLLGKADEAEAYYRQGASIFEKQAAEARVEEMKRNYQETLVQIWNQLGVLYTGQRRRQEARESLTKALNLAESI
ncbi:MAG: TonB family protein, partial [Acidobacteria bacterium]